MYKEEKIPHFPFARGNTDPLSSFLLFLTIHLPSGDQAFSQGLACADRLLSPAGIFTNILPEGALFIFARNPLGSFAGALTERSSGTIQAQLTGRAADSRNSGRHSGDHSSDTSVIFRQNFLVTWVQAGL